MQSALESGKSLLGAVVPSQGTWPKCLSAYSVQYRAWTMLIKCSSVGRLVQPSTNRRQLATSHEMTASTYFTALKSSLNHCTCCYLWDPFAFHRRVSSRLLAVHACPCFEHTFYHCTAAQLGLAGKTSGSLPPLTSARQKGSVRFKKGSRQGVITVFVFSSMGCRQLF